MDSADHVRGSGDIVKEQQILFWDIVWIAFVALVTQYALRMRRIVICGVPSSTVFFHTFINGRLYKNKKNFFEHKICFDFSVTSVWNINHSKNNWARYDNNAFT
jgi:hypothetical protein